MYPKNTVNKYPAFIKLNGVYMQYSHLASDENAIYAYFDSSQGRVDYISLSLPLVCANRQYLTLNTTDIEGEVVFAKNKTKLLVGLSSLTKTTQFKQGLDVTSLLSYGDDDRLNYVFGLRDTPPSVEDLEYVQMLSSRPTNFNKVVLDSLKEEQSYGWSMNQAMLSSGVFTYVEDLIGYQGNKEYNSWMFHFHVAA